MQKWEYVVHEPVGPAPGEKDFVEYLRLNLNTYGNQGYEFVAVYPVNATPLLILKKPAAE